MPPSDRAARQSQPSSGKVQRKTMAMLTLEAIREKILRGEYAEGAALRQDALAAELGVSRIPVREALRQLEVEGLVDVSPHVGAVVSTLSLEEIRELFEVRALIEGDLLRRAFSDLTPEILDEADRILAQYEEALASGEMSSWGSLNWQYHSTLYVPARHPLTVGIVQQLHNHSERYQRMQLALTHGERRANQEHRAILEAVRGGHEREAISLLTSHILGAGRSLLEFLREHRSPAARARASVG